MTLIASLNAFKPMHLPFFLVGALRLRKSRVRLDPSIANEPVLNRRKPKKKAVK